MGYKQFYNLVPVFVVLSLVVSLVPVQAQSPSPSPTASGDKLETLVLAPDGGLDHALAVPLAEHLGTTVSSGLDQSTVKELGVEKVVIIGGPAAGGDALVAKAESLGLEVVHLWGPEAVDTAQKVADYGWPTGDYKPTVVEYDPNYAAKSEENHIVLEASTISDGPLFPIPPGGDLPATLLAEFKEDGVTEVNLVGTLSTAEVASISQDLTDVGAKVGEQVVGTPTQVESQLEDKAIAQIEAGENVQIIVADDLKESFIPPVPGSEQIIVKSKAEAEAVLAEIKAKSVAEVVVAGDENLVKEFTPSVKSVLGEAVKVQQYTGAPAVIASNIVYEAKTELPKVFKQEQEKIKEEIKKNLPEMKKMMKTEVERMENQADLPVEAKRYLAKAREKLKAIEKTDNPDAIIDLLEIKENAEAEYNGYEYNNFVKADPTKRGEWVSQSFAGVDQWTQNLAAYNKEFSDAMKSAPLDQKLETIKALHLERADKIGDVVTAAQKAGLKPEQLFSGVENARAEEVKQEYQTKYGGAVTTNAELEKYRNVENTGLTSGTFVYEGKTPEEIKKEWDSHVKVYDALESKGFDPSKISTNSWGYFINQGEKLDATKLAAEVDKSKATLEGEVRVTEAAWSQGFHPGVDFDASKAQDFYKQYTTDAIYQKDDFASKGFANFDHTKYVAQAGVAPSTAGGTPVAGHPDEAGHTYTAPSEYTAPESGYTPPSGYTAPAGYTAPTGGDTGGHTGGTTGGTTGGDSGGGGYSAPSGGDSGGGGMGGH